MDQKGEKEVWREIERKRERREERKKRRRRREKEERKSFVNYKSSIIKREISDLGLGNKLED